LKTKEPHQKTKIEIRKVSPGLKASIRRQDNVREPTEEITEAAIAVIDDSTHDDSVQPIRNSVASESVIYSSKSPVDILDLRKTSRFSNSVRGDGQAILFDGGVAYTDDRKID
jgi:hypothetical protein